MYYIVVYTYLDQAETYTCQNSLNLIFQLNYFKENRTDIELIIIYELDSVSKRMQERLVLEIKR